MFRFFKIVILALLAIQIAIGAQAQSLTATTSSASTGEADTTLPDPLTPEAVEAMVARMSDDDVRAMLLDHLDTLTTEVDDSVPETFASMVMTAWDGLSFSTWGAIQRLPVLVSGQLEAIGNFFATYTVGGALLMFVWIAVILALAFGAERLVGQAFGRKQKDTETTTEDSTLTETIGFLARRFFREIVGLLAFYIVARVVGRLILTPEQIMFAGPLLAHLIWLPRLGAVFSRFILAPNRPDKRLVTVSDKWAKFLHRHLVGIVFLGGLTVFVVGFNRNFDVLPSATRIGFWFDTAVYVYLIYIAITAREGLITMMRGSVEHPTRYEDWAARAYPWYIIGVAVTIWVVVNTIVGLNNITTNTGTTGPQAMFRQLMAGAHYKTLFWLLIAPLLDTMIRSLTRHLVPP